MAELPKNFGKGGRGLHEGSGSKPDLYEILAALYNKVNALISGPAILTQPLLAIGTGSAAEIKITNDVVYVIGGVPYTLSAAEHAFTATTHDLADGEKARYLLSVDTGGTVTVTKGDSVLVAETAVTPDTPTGEAAIGYVEVQTVGAAFDATTTLLSAAEVTDTYVDYGLFTGNIDAMTLES